MDNNTENLSVYDRLHSQFGYIISELETAFLYRHKCDKESDLFLNFHDILIDRVSKFMKVYNPPENADEHFNLIRGFITQFRNHVYYSGAVKYCYTKTNQHFDNYISIVSEDERSRYHTGITEEMLNTDAYVEESVIQLDSQRRLCNAYNQFSTYLRPLEKLFFNAMRRGASTNEIVSIIGNSGFIAPTNFVAARIRKTLEFRLACFFAQEREVLFDRSIILKSLNKFPKQNLSAFGEEKLSEIPEQTILDEAIKGTFIRHKKLKRLNATYKAELVEKYDKQAEILKNNNEIFAQSKVDYFGKLHDHWVVYINHGLNCYCHVTGKRWELTEEVRI